MKSINLLPRIPVSKQYYGVLMSSIAAVTLAGLIGFTVTYVHNENEISAQSKLRDEYQSKYNALLQQRMTDPKTAVYNAFFKDLTKQKEASRDWTPVFEAVTSKLPAAARLLSMDADANAKLKVSLEIRSLEETTDYVVLLQNAHVFETVSITGIQKKTIQQPAAPQTAVKDVLTDAGSTTPSQTDVTGRNASPLAATASPAPNNTITTDQYLELLNKKNAGASNTEPNQADEMLKELDWMVNQRMSSQLHGIQVPDRTPSAAAPTPAPSSSSPITEEDIQKARKTLESLQQVTVVPSLEPAPNSSNPVPDRAGTEVTAEGQAASQAKPEAVIYAVTLELQCKR